MRPKRELDAYTLRHAAERLTERAEQLRSFAEQKYWRQYHHFFHRAAELEAMADALVGVASLTKKPRKAK